MAARSKFHLGSRSSVRAWCAALSAALAWTTPAAAATPPSALDPNPYSVMRPESIAPFFAAARERRVDMAIIGDSNTRYGTSCGLENALGRAFTERLGCYATRVDPVGAVGGWVAECMHSSCSPFESYTGEASLDVPLIGFPTERGFPSTYFWLDPGEEIPYVYNTGLGVAAAHPVDISGPLRWHMSFYRFPAPGAGEPSGYFSPSCRERWPGSAANNYAFSTVNTTGAQAPGFVDWSMDVPAGPRAPTGLMFCLANFAHGQGMVGPFYAEWNRIENTAKDTGVAFSPLLYQGGQSTRDAALSLLNSANQASMAEWFRQVTRLQNGPPTLLIQIIQGSNDAATELPAIVYERGMPTPVGDQWPLGAPTNTKAGLKQNFMSVINRVRDYWAAAGYDEDNLYFIIGSYFPHPPSWYESEPGAGDGGQFTLATEAAIPAWREICAEQQNVAYVNGYQLSTWQEFTVNSWYRIPNLPPPFGDQAHLSPNGYTAWGNAVAEAVTRACDCGPSVDIDLNGRREVADIFAFLSLWFAADPRANFDQVGATPAVPDIFAFLSSWFAGCAGH